MSQKPMKLEMDFPTSNTFVQDFNSCCCNWGQRKTPYDQNGNIIGKTAPLWVNPAKTFFCVFFVLNFIISLCFVAGFIVVKYYVDEYADDDSGCKSARDSLKEYFIVIGAVILFINSLYWLFIYCKEYSTDQEWSRYFIILVFFWCCNVGFLIAEILNTLKILDDYKDNKDEWFKNNKNCKKVFVAGISLNFCVSGFNAIISIIMIIRVIIIAKNFFFVSFVPHDASCEDEDIIVIE